MTALTAAWQDFTGVLKIYGNALASLNPPCPPNPIRDAESALGFALPNSLAELLKLNNGQKLDSPGIFKSISGWDVYRRSVFLDAESVVIAYRAFVGDEGLLKVFGDKEIPFAVAGSPSSYDEMFSVNRDDGRVSLLWTGAGDPFLPFDWRVARYKRGNDLAEFIRAQAALFR